MKILDKLILKNIWIKQFQWNTVTWLHLEQQSFFDVYWEEPLPERNHKNIGNHSKSFFFIIFIQNGIKRIRIGLLDESRDSCSYSADCFFLISVETDILCEKEQICGSVLKASKGYPGNNYFIKIIWNRKEAWHTI